MIDLIFAFDELDHDIGSFNQGCKEDYEEYFSESPYFLTFINSNQLNATNVQIKVTKLNSFIFVAYSHGEAHRLLTSSGEYISTSINNLEFKNSFFYTVSCNTGNELGNELCKQGCLCYLGYKSQFNSWSGYKQFSTCANVGLFKFVEGSSTASVMNLMKECYNNCIDGVYKEDYLVASLLRENRDGLIMIGEDLTIERLLKINSDK